MDYVARAKALLIWKARTGALLVLPLAAAVQHAQAQTTLTLPTGHFNCSALFTASGGCSGGVANTPAQYGLSGLRFGLSSPVTLIGPGILTLSNYGTVTGTSGGSLGAGTPMRLSYDFTLSTSGGSFSDWQLQFQMYDYAESANVLNGSVSGSATGTFSGSFTVQLGGPLSQGDLVYDSASITVNNLTSGGATVTVPLDSSLDIDAAAPEPSTLSFGALGLALAGIRGGLRRKRRAERGK